MILCNIPIHNTPNKGGPHFFHEVNKVIGDVEGQIILAGDFNPILDKNRPKGLRTTKDREAIHMLKDDMGLTHIWRLINPCEREYTVHSILPGTNPILELIIF